MQLGGIEVQTTATRQEQLTMLLWGKVACGKTVLASTAPGKKLWLQFDPSGTASLPRRDDVLVADFAQTKPAQLAQFKQGSTVERDLIKLLKENDIGTVVVDSLTTFGQLALSYAVLSGKGDRGTFKASVEQPGQTGYGVRSGLVLDFCTMVLRACLDHKTHCIFIAHEQEVNNDDGSVKEITISIGGQGKLVVPAKISEIWRIEDTGRSRLAYVRNQGVFQPMRSRMFIPDAQRNRFTCTYDMMNGNGLHIAELYEQWQASGFNRIPLPQG